MREGWDEDYDAQVQGKWHHVESAHASTTDRNTLGARKGHAVLRAAKNTVSGLVGVTSNAKLIAPIVPQVAVLGGATAGTGLLVGAGVLYAVGMGTSAVSAYKTNQHIDNLCAIQQGGSASAACTCLRPGGLLPDMAMDHNAIAATILPYIITQKRHKLVRKGADTAGLSPLTKAYTVGRSVYKRAAGTRGVTRDFYAHILARHIVTHDCSLGAAIVSELFSPADYAAICQMNSDKAGALLGAKMRSI